MTPWPQLPLGEIAKVSSGDSAPQGADAFSHDGKPFVRMQDVGRHGRTDNLTETTDRVSEVASGNLKVFPKGSILVPKSGASIRLNHRAILGIDAHVVSHLAVVQPEKGVNGRFLYYWLCSVDMSKVAHETDFPSLRLQDLEQLLVPLPSPPVQERIVRILDEAEALSRLRVQADERARTLVAALFEEMFGDLARNARGWPIRPLEDLLTDGPQNGLYKHSSFYGEGTPILRIDAFYDGEVRDVSALKRLRTTEDEVRRYQLRENDIVINRVNSPEYLGKSALIRGLVEPSVFESNMMRLAVRTSDADPVYIIRLLQMPVARQHIMTRAKDAINQSSINQEDVKSLPVPLPPLSLQRAFASRVAEIRALEAAQADSRKHLDNLFRSLLHRAFQGEL